MTLPLRPAPLPPIEIMHAAFAAADPEWDGRFVAAVRTTGIFCRPSCRVRKPFARNVVFMPDPAAARAAGYRACLRCHPEAGTTVHLRSVDTSIGRLLLGATDRAAVLCDFEARPMIAAQVASVRRRIGPTQSAQAGEPTSTLDALEREVDEYLAGRRTAFDVPFDAPGSAFQEAVWRELRVIPYGATISYRELARRVGEPAASRAVGRANGSNRLAVLIPCHRVIASSGGLGGYGGGLDAKRRLLELERRTAAAVA